MSLNTAHANGGVLIHSGEYIMIFTDNVQMEFLGNPAPEFNGTKNGRIYLTTHRMIFNSRESRDPLQSFSFPFVTIQDVELEQPIFGANYIKGHVRAQPNGNWVGEAKFKLVFKSGGCIEFGQAMLRAAHMAQQNAHNMDAPPPYTPSSPQDWYAAPPPAYTPPVNGIYGFVPPTNVFPNQPPPNSVFMINNPPPYPGIYPGLPTNDYSSSAPGYPGYPPPNSASYPPQNPPGYSPQNGPGYPSQSAPGYPPQSAPGYPPQGAPGYPPQGAPGYPPQGAPGYPAGGSNYPPQNGFGYPNNGPGYIPQNGPPGYPPQNGYTASGSSQLSQDAKAAEAAQSAYYDPNRPQMAYVPPPAYYENPPTYQNALAKKNE